MTLVLGKIDKEFLKELEEKGAETLQRCYQCGTCVADCPATNFPGFNIRRIMHKASLGLRDLLLNDETVWRCTTCYTCYERCPQNADPTYVIFAIRRFQAENGRVPEAQKEVAKNIYTLGHAITIAKAKELRKKLGLEELPPTAAKYPEAIEELQKIIEGTKAIEIFGLRKDWKAPSDEVKASD
ncbi:MAG: 4Fe-4S dicluster domain-containing protein [Archaeoglobi archaeon]|nr:4Fe-4S dicluster domain-containing protein [Candidatus Mnemosynella bozhongmuii]